MNKPKPNIGVYTADIAPLQNTELFDRAYRTVSDERREKTDRMRFLKGKCQSLGVECLLIHACRDFDVRYGNGCILAEENKKPVVAAGAPHFNLSHSEDRVMCIMSDLPVGCDVEKIRTADIGIAKRFFAKEEITLLEDCTTQQERDGLFYRIWTLKESFQKCTGLGFQLPLDAFSICFTPDGIHVTQSVDKEEYLLF